MEVINIGKKIADKLKKELGTCGYGYDEEDYRSKIIYIDNFHFEKFLDTQLFINNLILKSEYNNYLSELNGDDIDTFKNIIYQELEGYVYNYYNLDDIEDIQYKLNTDYKDKLYGKNPKLYSQYIKSELGGNFNKIKCANLYYFCPSFVHGNNFNTFIELITLLPKDITAIDFRGGDLKSIIGNNIENWILFLNKLPKNLRHIKGFRNLFYDILTVNLNQSVKILSHLPKNFKILDLEYLCLSDYFKNESDIISFTNSLPKNLKIVNFKGNYFSELTSGDLLIKLLSNLNDSVSYCNLLENNLGSLYKENINQMVEIASSLPRNLKVIDIEDNNGNGESGGSLGYVLQEKGNIEIINQFINQLPNELVNYNFDKILRHKLINIESYTNIFKKFINLRQARFINGYFDFESNIFINNENEINKFLKNIPKNILKLEFIDFDIMKIWSKFDNLVLDFNRFQKLRYLSIREIDSFQLSIKRFLEFIKLLPRDLKGLHLMINLNHIIVTKNDFFSVIENLPKNLEQLTLSKFNNLNNILHSHDDIELYFSKLPIAIDNIDISNMLNCYHGNISEYIDLFKKYGYRIQVNGGNDYIKIFAGEIDLYTNFIIENYNGGKWKFIDSFCRFLGCIFEGEPEKLFELIEKLPDGSYLHFERGGFSKIFGRKRKVKQECLTLAEKKGIILDYV